MSIKIRPLYDEHGIEGYYRAFGSLYKNPHEAQVAALLNRNYWRMGCSSGTVLDFAAGSGEVARVLLSLGMDDILGCDPFTYELFEEKTGLPCLRLSFMDIVRKGLPGKYSCIVCSFALHLCPAKDLFPLTWQLFHVAPLIVVITPHKRPELEKMSHITLEWEDGVETEKGKKVRMKAYSLKRDKEDSVLPC